MQTHTHPTSTHTNLKRSMNLELPCVWVFAMIDFKNENPYRLAKRSSSCEIVSSKTRAKFGQLLEF
jgi:hypothetical protein